MRKKLLGVVLGVVMILGAAAGIVQSKSGPLQDGPPLCPPEICPGTN